MQTAIEALEATVKMAESAMIPSSVAAPRALEGVAAALGRAVGPSVQLPHVDLGDATFWQAVLLVVLQPLIWNVIGRVEHHTRVVTRVVRRPQIGVYLLAAWIFAAGRYRDAVLIDAMDRQEKVQSLGELPFRVFGVACVAVGMFLVLTSFLRLGVNGTFLGDYFGILMDEPVTAFPFSVLDDPMYDGSSLAFLGKAVLAKSPTGLVLTVWVYVMYRVAGIVEGAFLREVYAQRDRAAKKA